MSVPEFDREIEASLHPPIDFAWRKTVIGEIADQEPVCDWLQAMGVTVEDLAHRGSVVRQPGGDGVSILPRDKQCAVYMRYSPAEETGAAGADVVFSVYPRPRHKRAAAHLCVRSYLGVDHSFLAGQARIAVRNAETILPLIREALAQS
ncbi:MAG: hypothetical protein WBO35_04310 [Candidatus Saccharimonadales bacterium]